MLSFVKFLLITLAGFDCPSSASSELWLRPQMPETASPPLFSLWIGAPRCPLLILSLIHSFVSSDWALNSHSPPLPQSCLWREMCVMVLTLAQLLPILSFLNGSFGRAEPYCFSNGELCWGEESSYTLSQPGCLSIWSSVCSLIMQWVSLLWDLFHQSKK